MVAKYRSRYEMTYALLDCLKENRDKEFRSGVGAGIVACMFDAFLSYDSYREYSRYLLLNGLVTELKSEKFNGCVKMVLTEKGLRIHAVLKELNELLPTVKRGRLASASAYASAKQAKRKN